MKKGLLSLMLPMITGLIMAQNTLTVSETTIPQNGGDLLVTLQLGTTDIYCAYQFNVETQEGLVYDTNDENDVECRLNNGHDSSHGATAHWKTDERVLTVGVISSKSALLKGTTAELVIPIAETTAAVGTELTLKFTGITFIQTSGAKDELADVTVTVTIGEPDDGRIKFYENSTKLPNYTAGETANVEVFRTIKANEWSTLVLPFTLTKAKAENAFGKDVQFAKFTGFEVDYGDDEENVIPLGISISLEEYTIPTRGGLTGGTPVLIKTSKDIESFKIDEVKLFDAVKDVEVIDEYETDGKLTGTLTKTVIPADGLFISDNKFWYSTGKTNIKAFRCWFELGAVLDKETAWSRIALHFNDTPTNISEIGSRDSKDGRYYDLQGRSVVKPVRGLYIRDGKKEIVK